MHLNEYHLYHTSISFYNKVKEIVPGMSDLIGLRKLYEEYEAIRKVNPNGLEDISYSSVKRIARARTLLALLVKGAMGSYDRSLYG